MVTSYYITLFGHEFLVSKFSYIKYERKCGFNAPQGVPATRSFLGRYIALSGKIIEVSGRIEELSERIEDEAGG